MKKQILISSFVAAAILGGTAILSVAKAESPKNEQPTLIAANSLIAPQNPIFNTSKTETVYVMTDENSNIKNKFIGSTLYTGTEELPFNMNATYYLDSAEISAKDLAGKSGHIKIVFDYNSTATRNGKFIPFLALTTINLNHQKFTNIKLSNGRIFNENDTTYTVIGYALTGFNKNLGTNILPDTFILEADATDFKLEDTYTIFTNDIFTDIDLSALSRIDELTSAIYQLEDAMNKLVAGASDLSNGLASALDGTKTLYEGSQTLAEGTKDALEGSQKLSDGLTTITSKNETLQNAATEIIGGICKNEDGNPIPTEDCLTDMTNKITYLTQIIQTLDPASPEYQEKYKTLVQLTTYKNIVQFALGVVDYTDGVAKTSAGATELSTGLAKLSAGTTTISNGLGSLVEGQAKLYQGSITLRDGLITFKTSGIDKLVNFASKDLANFARNLRSTINAASSYKNFGGVDAKSVKFIVKTPSI